MRHPKALQLRSHAALRFCMPACLVCQRLLAPLLHLLGCFRCTHAHLSKTLCKVDLLVALRLEKSLLNGAHVFQLFTPCFSADLCIRQCHRTLSEVVNTLSRAEARGQAQARHTQDPPNFLRQLLCGILFASFSVSSCHTDGDSHLTGMHWLPLRPHLLA